MTFRNSLLALAVFVVGSGCAHSAPVAAASPTSPPPVTPVAAKGKKAPPATTHLQNEDLGISIDLPASAGFQPSSKPGRLAHSADGTEIDFSIEHLTAEATESACWTQLFARIPKELASPRDPEELAALAKAGIRRGDHFIYISVVPRSTHCYVLIVDGPADSEQLMTVAPMAQRTFHVGEPSKPMAAELNIVDGSVLMQSKNYPAALGRFEQALTQEPKSLRAELGAGLAAYFSGAGYGPKAVDYLSKYLSGVSEARDDDERPQTGELNPEQVRDALMFLGLAYAGLKDYGHATSTLAELVTRYPEDATGRYNFACVLALSKEPEEALAELREAFRREPDLATHATEDDDLVSLRPRPEWKDLLDHAAAAKTRQPPHP